MLYRDWTMAFRDIIDDALGTLSADRVLTTNLYVNVTPYEKGTVLGPKFQKIFTSQPCILVFADEDPMANFGHDCRYRLYDEKSHEFLVEVPARFPPYGDVRPDSFRAVHEPIRVRPGMPPTSQAIAGLPLDQSRERYAILFSGSSHRRHLNDLEFSYRILTERYGFKPGNIIVLYPSLTPTADGHPATRWPAELTNGAAPGSNGYKLKINYVATRENFKKACIQIADVVHAADLVFIQAAGDGDARVENGQIVKPYLIDANHDRYEGQTFCSHLGLIGPHESMQIMMAQCYSARLIDDLVAPGTIKAQRLSIACASLGKSYRTPDGLFNRFGEGWLAAHLDTDPYGQSVPNPDADSSGYIEADEAYEYAASVKDARDKPMQEHRPVDARKIRLV